MTLADPSIALPALCCQLAGKANVWTQRAIQDHGYVTDCISQASRLKLQLPAKQILETGGCCTPCQIFA